MEVVLAFLALTFVAGARSAADASTPGRWMLLGLTVVVSVALLSHRLA